MMFKLRSNFAETAYYVSNIRSNDKGEIEIEFDLPDTLTTWKLMVVAFTQDMHWCTFEKEFISRKDIMVQANMPRFTRVGDHTVVTAKVTNQSGQKMKETVCIVGSLDEPDNILAHDTMQECANISQSSIGKFLSARP